MKKRVPAFLLLCVLVSAVAFGGNKVHTRAVADAERASGPVRGTEVWPASPTALTWVAVDTMQNAFGPANGNINPMAYDNALNALVVVHRGATTYAPSSGSLIYNRTFPNAGGTAPWRRIMPDLNAGTSATCRYPSVAISNPANSADTSQALVVWSAPNLLNAGTFGGISYGVDPFGAGTPFAVAMLGDSTYSSQTSIWTRTASPWVYWAADHNPASAARGQYWLWRTQDYITVTEGVPASWRGDSLGANFTYICGKERGGVSYFGIWSVWTGDSADAVNVGYSRSTDNGATWGSWQRPSPGNWTRIPAVQASIYRTWADYTATIGDNTVGHSFDMVVDANGYPHFFGAVADTSFNEDQQGILEVYRTATGWDAKIIKTGLNRRTVLNYNTLFQTGRCVRASASPDGTVLSVAWLDAGTSASTDTLADIWFSSRTITGNWATATNLTATPNQAEMILHAAPTLKRNSATSYTVFLGRTYESGVTTFPPTDANRSVFYVAQHTFSTTGVDDVTGTPARYALDQNYPNPFNPSTKISYTIPTSSNVKISVTNVLGQEVATVVNEFKTAGQHDATFSAQGLPSGIYFYTLKAGQFSETKKMVLMK